MATIQYQDGKKYNIDTQINDLQYVDTGDRHGNNNFRLNSKFLSAFDVVSRISPDHITDLVAVYINDVLSPLDTSINSDCRLVSVKNNSEDGMRIVSDSLALLAIEAVLRISGNCHIDDVTIKQEEINIHLIHIPDNFLSEFLNQWNAILTENVSIHMKDIWLKEVLLENYSELYNHSYFQRVLDHYDDYEIVPVVEHGGYFIPVQEKALYTLMPITVKSFIGQVQLKGNSVCISLKLK